MEGFIDQARKTAAYWAARLVARHIAEGLQGEGETARKCREYILNHVLGDPSRRTTNVPMADVRAVERPDLLEHVSPEKRERILDILGAPEAQGGEVPRGAAVSPTG